MQQICLDRLQLEKINAELSSLRETNPKRTMRGGNLNDYIFVINWCKYTKNHNHQYLLFL